MIAARDAVAVVRVVAVALEDRYADAPAARRIREHLGLPWPEVRELAPIAGRGRSSALGHALDERQGDWLTPEYSDGAGLVPGTTDGLPVNSRPTRCRRSRRRRRSSTRSGSATVGPGCTYAAPRDLI